MLEIFGRKGREGGKARRRKDERRDEMSFIIEDLVRFRKRFAVALYLCIFLVFVSYIPVFYFLFFKRDRVILLDASGKPQLSYTVADRGLIPHEVQSFLCEVTNLVYNRSYVDFMDSDAMKSLYRKFARYFYSRKALRYFWTAYVNSPFVRSLLKNKYVVKVGPISSFDVKRAKDGYVAYGVIKITAYSSGESVVIQNKKIVIYFKKALRTWENPYGLYVVRFMEKETIDVTPESGG